jgi:prepilin-type N-terminal cleavage/methylation domain-containing protein
MRMRSLGRRGTTLTELLIVVAIVGVMASVAPLMMKQLENFYLMTTARNDIERDARNTLDVINRFLRQAIGSTIVIDTPTSQGIYSRIRFKGVDGRNYEFRQSGTSLLQDIGGVQSTISKNLVYIAFTFPQTDNPTIVSVSLTMGKSIQLGRRKVLELTIQNVRVMN